MELAISLQSLCTSGLQINIIRPCSIGYSNTSLSQSQTKKLAQGRSLASRLFLREVLNPSRVMKREIVFAHPVPLSLARPQENPARSRPRPRRPQPRRCAKPGVTALSEQEFLRILSEFLRLSRRISVFGEILLRV